jgi:flagellar basal-body rod protein FlgB
MPITDFPILSMLRTKMQWHQARQRVLAENVANADTPQFKPRDLAPPDVGPRQFPISGPVALARTNVAHIGGAGSAGAGPFRAEYRAGYEVRPTGNAVNLEDQMMKVAANQMDHQVVASLYSRSLGLLKTALGKR